MGAINQKSEKNGTEYEMTSPTDCSRQKRMKWSERSGREQCADSTHILQRVKQDRCGQQEVAGSNVQVALTSCRG